MFPTLIEIFSFQISTYGVLVALGLFLGYLLSMKLAKEEGLPSDKAELVFVMAVVGGIVGSRIAFVLEHPEEFKSLIDVLALWKGGVSFFGALIGGLVLGVSTALKVGLPLWKVADIASPALALAHSIGRLGCFSAGCCYGRPVPNAESVEVGIHFMKEFPFFYIVFPQGAVAPNSIPLYPTQLMEAFGNFVIFLVLIILFKRKTFDGEIFSLYLFLYGVERFALEFYRGVTPPIEGLGLTWNQIVSILLVAGSIVLFFILRKQSKEVLN